MKSVLTRLAKVFIEESGVVWCACCFVSEPDDVACFNVSEVKKRLKLRHVKLGFERFESIPVQNRS